MKARIGIIIAVVTAAALLWRSGDDTRSATPSTSVAPTAVPRPTKPSAVVASAAARITGVVTSEDGKPLAATVCAARVDETEGLPRCTTSGDDGRYEVSVEPARHYMLASAHGFRPVRERAREIAAGATETIDLSLRAGGVEVTGVISDLGGGPIPHALVWERHGVERGAITKADSLGRYTLWADRGQSQFAAVADGYAEAFVSGVAPGTVDIALAPESSVSGIVVDPSDRPLAGVDVRAMGSGDTWIDRSVRTDERGTFHFDKLSPSRLTITASSPNGFGRAAGSTRLSLGQHVTGIVVKLHPAMHVSGAIAIAGTTKRCVEDAGVVIEDKARERYYYLRADGDGFRADGVLPGTYSVEVRCAGHRVREYPPIAITNASVDGVLWEVERNTASLRGRVRTASGRPVDGTIYARPTLGASASTQTTRDGNYELAVGPGKHCVRVTTTDAATPDAWGGGCALEVDIPEATAKIERDIVLDDAGTIEGVVIDVDGKPVVGAQIGLRDSEGTTRFSSKNVSSSAGAFVIEGLRPGEYGLLVKKEWRETMKSKAKNDRVTVRANERAEVRLVVESQSGTISGVVVDAAGAPVTDAYVVAARESDEHDEHAHPRFDDRTVLTGVDGKFVLGGLTKGPHTVRAMRRGGGEAIAAHVITGTAATLRIARTGAIVGTMPGDPADLIVRARDPQTQARFYEPFYKTGGTFELRDVPAGRYVVDVIGDGRRMTGEVDVADGKTATVELVDRAADAAPRGGLVARP